MHGNNACMNPATRGRWAGVVWAVLTCCAVGSANEINFDKKTYVYKSAGETPIHADVYRAKDHKLRPVLVWIHGGALIFGGRGDVHARLIELCFREGFVLISIDYRLAPEVKLGAIVEDVRDAIEWVRQEGPTLFQADASRLVVAGESAGGFLTMMSGVMSRPKPTALVAYYGYGTVDGPWYTHPSDHYRKALPIVDPADAERQVHKGVLTQGSLTEGRGKYYLYLRQNGLWTEAVTGHKPTEKEKLDPLCPVRNFSPDFPPTLLLHGTHDTDVPYEESAAMARELKRLGVQHEFVTLQGSGHGLIGGNAEHEAAAHEKAMAFIRKHLVADSPAGTDP